MKYLTKLIVPDVPASRTYPLEIEAESARQAAHAALGHWQRNWDGLLPNTGPVIYVYDGSAQQMFKHPYEAAISSVVMRPWVGQIGITCWPRESATDECSAVVPPAKARSPTGFESALPVPLWLAEGASG